MLTAAVAYAYSLQYRKTINMFVRVPYYSSYKPQCDAFSQYCNWTQVIILFLDSKY